MYELIEAARKPSAKPDVTVLLILKEQSKLDASNTKLAGRSAETLATLLSSGEFSGKCGEFFALPGERGERVALLGLGDAKKLNIDKVGEAAAGLIKGLHRINAATATLGAQDVMPHLEFAEALGVGAGLSNYSFRDFKRADHSDDSKKKAKTLWLSFASSKDAAGSLQKGLALADSVNFARRLGATPPNVATPAYIAAQAKALARDGGLKIKVIEGRALIQNKLVGLENVGKASEIPPCLIELEYTPRGKSTGTVVLVGKTICYDTGGLSIKPREGMRGMKYDKCGGMAVLGAMHAVARIKPACRVIAILPTAENSISANAYRVDDILRYPNGVSVEITNTDAEGRLVLADGLIYACKHHKPDAIIDLATLTGGVVVALGHSYAGYWCEDAALREKLEAASAASGEKIWRLPMHSDYKEMMKAKHADLWNSAPVRDAHPIQGAAFLSNFVDAKIPWAHIDIAGTADSDKDKPPISAGATGYGVRLLAALLQKWN